MTRVSDILNDVINGSRIKTDDIRLLFEKAKLLDLGQAAGSIRRQKTEAGVATYIIDRNINYTNVCIYRCRFCAFYRDEKANDAYLLPIEEIFEKISETVAAGGTGILLQGGVHPKLRISYYEDLLRQLKTKFPEIHLHAFSAPEIWFIAKLEKITISEVISRLQKAGLKSIPGGGAEILEDDVRRRIFSQTKASTDTWIAVHRAAHELNMRTTATMMFGVGESYDARIAHFEALRNLQDETGGFTAFIPWTFQEGGTAMEGEVRKSGAYDYLRTLAISRLVFDNIDHVQGSWVTQGSKLGQVSLYFGADDLGSIMLEENVVAAAGVKNQMNRADMESVITGAGLIPRQRRTLYEEM